MADPREQRYVWGPGEIEVHDPADLGLDVSQWAAGPPARARYNFDAGAHPRGQPANRGQFRRRAAEAVAATGRALTDAEHRGAEMVERAVARLPERIRPAVRLAGRYYFASFAAAEGAARQLAEATGRSPEEAERLARALTLADLAGVKLAIAAAHSLDLGVVGAGVAGFVPLASLGFLLATTARHPVRTLNAAHRAVRASLAATPERYAADHVAEQTHVALMERLRGRPDEAYLAVLAAALDHSGGDLGRAMLLADRAAGRL